MLRKLILCLVVTVAMTSAAIAAAPVLNKTTPDCDAATGMGCFP